MTTRAHVAGHWSHGTGRRLYDAIGEGHPVTRRTEPRIAARIWPDCPPRYLCSGDDPDGDAGGGRAAAALPAPGEGFRWVTVGHPSQPELEVTLMTPGPPLEPDAADFVRRQLEAGKMGGLGLRVDDCRKTYEELSGKGVEFLQEPSDRPYGVEAVMRDISGNWLVLVEPKEFTPGDFA